MRTGLRNPFPEHIGTDFWVSIADGNGKDYAVFHPARRGLPGPVRRLLDLSPAQHAEIVDTLEQALAFFRDHPVIDRDDNVTPLRPRS